MHSPRFGWDPRKARLNLAKHAIDFADAATALEGEIIQRFDRRKAYGEVRFRAIGEAGGRILLVVVTVRGDTIRIISARPANAVERRKHRALHAARPAPE